MPWQLRVIPKFVIAHMANYGILQASTILEIAAAKLREVAHKSVDGSDLADGADVKFRTVDAYDPDPERHYATITVENNYGWIIAQILEEHTNKFYYFAFPPDSHADVDSIGVPFLNGGVPARDSHWWDHECKTLRQAARRKPPRLKNLFKIKKL